MSLLKQILKKIFFDLRFFVLAFQIRFFLSGFRVSSSFGEKKSYSFSGLRRSLPKTIEKKVHINFVSQLNLKKKKASVFFLRNSFVSLKEGFIFLSSGKLFDKNYLYLPVIGYPKLLLKLFFPPTESINVPVCIIPGTSNYFHWMFEALPRLLILKKFGIKPGVFLSDTSCFFQKESLKTILSNKTKILPLLDSKSYLVKDLIVPCMPQYSGNPSKEVCNYLKKVFLTSKKIDKQYEKIYVCRGITKNNRSVINEREIVSYLEKNGFMKVCMDGLSITRQAQIFNSAKVIVAPHGGALSNLVFAKKGTKVIEIFHPDYVNACFWALSNCVELDYYYFLASKHGWIDFSLGTTINLEKLSSALKYAKVI